MVMVTLASSSSTYKGGQQWSADRDARLSTEPRAKMAEWRTVEPNRESESDNNNIHHRMGNTHTTMASWTADYICICMYVSVCVHKLFSIFERRVPFCTFPLTIIAGLCQPYTFSFVVVFAIRYAHFAKKKKTKTLITIVYFSLLSQCLAELGNISKKVRNGGSRRRRRRWHLW